MFNILSQACNILSIFVVFGVFDKKRIEREVMSIYAQKTAHKKSVQTFENWFAR
jgi:hypothetical protein